MNDYVLVIAPLPEEEGGGYVAVFPDLPGCMSDGDTPEEAAANARDAMNAWIQVQTERGIDIPLPGASADKVSAKLKSLIDSLKAMIDYAEAADEHIDHLEKLLEKAIEDLDSGWRQSGVIAAHAVSSRRIVRRPC